MPLFNINKGIETVTNFADDSFESKEEAEATRTERQKIDLTSVFKLPHLIRPILALWTAVAFSFALVYGMVTEVVTGLEAMGATTILVTAAIKFYFESRKAEKIMTMKASGALEMEKIKVKENIRKDKVAEKAEKKRLRKSR